MAGHRPPVRRGSRPDHTDGPVRDAAHVATWRADAAEHGHAPDGSASATRGGAARRPPRAASLPHPGQDHGHRTVEPRHTAKPTRPRPNHRRLQQTPTSSRTPALQGSSCRSVCRRNDAMANFCRPGTSRPPNATPTAGPRRAVPTRCRCCWKSSRCVSNVLPGGRREARRRRAIGSPQAWRTRPAHRPGPPAAHGARPRRRRPPPRTCPGKPPTPPRVAPGAGPGRAPGMGPDVGRRGARRRPHGGHRSGGTRITPDRSPPRGRVRQPRWPRPPGIAAAHAPAPTRDRPGRSSTRERPAPGGTGRRRRRHSHRNAGIASAERRENWEFETHRQLPRSLAAVVELIEQLHPERIVFTEEAKKSALNATLDDPNVGWECLHMVATVLPRLAFDESSKDLASEFQRRSGFELSLTEGKMTKKDQALAGLRKITFEGRQWNVSPHVKYGTKPPKCLRVHFALDTDEQRVIVGYCGDHMKTAGTKRRK